MEDFSLNLLCRGDSHLLPSTLDSLKSQQGSFEVVLIDAEGGGKLQELSESYGAMKVRVEKAPSPHLAEMMNLGLKVSKGKYIQFLEPGDRYISQYGISFLTDLIQKAPVLISAREVSEGAKSHWLLRKEAQKIGGFDERLSSRPMLDLLCRLEKSGVKPLVCSRAFIDSAKEGKSSFWETCKILYRHFGLSYMLKWLFRNPSKPFYQAVQSCKEAFRKDPDSF